jgi:hypothetical protein
MSGGSFHVATYVPISSETATFLRGDWQEIPSTRMVNAQTRFPFTPTSEEQRLGGRCYFQVSHAQSTTVCDVTIARFKPFL